MLQYAGVPEDAGISSLGVQAFLDGAERLKLDFHSVMLLRQGKVACRLVWQPYASDTPHTLFSLSKSFCSCAAGWRWRRAPLRYDDKVMWRFSTRCRPSRRTHRGHHAAPPAQHVQRLWRRNPTRSRPRWTGAATCCPIRLCTSRHGVSPNTLGTYLVSAMVQRPRGRPCGLPDAAAVRAAGIQSRPGTAAPWASAGGYGLHLSCEDIAEVRAAAENDGIWQGKRRCPRAADRATARIIKTADQEVTDSGPAMATQFWRIARFPRRRHVRAALPGGSKERPGAGGHSPASTTWAPSWTCCADTLLKASDMPPAPADAAGGEAAVRQPGLPLARR